MFVTVESKSISQIVVEQIQSMIINGELKRGDKLPPERQLTEMLGVGRPAIREALKALEVVGLIERRHGQGNFIAHNMENSFYKPLSLSFKLSNGNIHEVLTLREVIEAFTVGEASEKASEEDIRRLYAAHENMKAEADVRTKAEYDRQLHYEIAKISGNKLIISIMESISYLMAVFIDKSVYISLYMDHSIENLYEEHLSIIRAIERHDRQAAVQAIADHLKKINVSLLDKTNPPL